ncbi:autophagy protein 5 [Haematococcus lacustris]|uniref:Autophagy protein 5 n=1 Tax=Haematococcus lacustris TaxID=44745 RepID=A0A6A0A669_HAELA|nr:autophagy protein 5 [Haematococcus lacustris]
MPQMQAPRQAYPCSLAAQVWPLVQHVLPSIPGQAGRTQLPEPWLQWNQLALKMSLPLGVMWDLLHEEPPSSCPGPWPLTMHFTTRLPPHATQAWLAELPLKAQFLNSLKVSCLS